MKCRSIFFNLLEAHSNSPSGIEFRLLSAFFHGLAHAQGRIVHLPNDRIFGFDLAGLNSRIAELFEGEAGSSLDAFQIIGMHTNNDKDAFSVLFEEIENFILDLEIDALFSQKYSHGIEIDLLEWLEKPNGFHAWGGYSFPKFIAWLNGLTLGARLLRVELDLWPDFDAFQQWLRRKNGIEREICWSRYLYFLVDSDDRLSLDALKCELQDFKKRSDCEFVDC